MSIQQLRLVPWFDRNPVNIVRFSAVTGIPHGEFNRWSYSVPKNRKAILELLVIKVIRATAAVNASGAKSYITLTIEGETPKAIGYCLTYGNNVNDKDVLVAGHSILLSPGDMIKAYDSDASNGGTVHFVQGIKATEFDQFPLELPPWEPELPEVDIQDIKKPWWQWW